MRQYLFGVFILVLGQLCSEAFCDQNDHNGISIPIFSDSVSSTEDDYESLKSVLEEFSGEDTLGSPLQFPDVDESLAYWQSIYGTEDVPDFDEPPSIDGDSIFMDVSELTDDDLAEGEIVKLAGDIQSPLVRQKRSVNLEEGSETLSEMIEHGKIHNSQSSASQTVSISKKEQRKSSRSRKSESRCHRRKTTSTGANSVIDSKLRLIQEKKDLIDAVVTGATQAEIADAVHHTMEAKQGLIDSVISAKADLIQGKSDISHSHGASNRDISLSTGSLKSEGSLGPILDAAQGALQAKQDLINVVVTGGSTAELADAVQHTMEAKQGLISAKVDLIQGKNDLSHSHGGFNHDIPLSTGCLKSEGSLGPILDAAQGALQAKQDLINVVVTGGSTAELADAVQHTMEAKKELIDSVISSKAELLQANDIHSRQRVFIDTGASGSLHSQDSLGRILNSAQEALEAKQDLINVAILGGSRSDLADAVQHTLKAKEDLIDSVISSKADILNTRDAIQSQGSLGQILDSAQEALGAKQDLIEVAVAGGSNVELSGAIAHTIRAKEELIDSVISDLIQRKRNLINSHCRLHNRQDCSQCQETLNPILDSAQELLQKKKDLIDVVAARGTKTEFCDALHQTIGAKKDLMDTVISTKADIMQQKKDLINSHAGLEHGSSGSLGEIIDLKKKVLKEKKNLIDVALSGGSKSELADAMVKTLDAKGDLIDSVTSNRAERILNKKEYSRHRAESSCCGRSRHRESSRNTNSRFSTSFQSGSISSDKQHEGINLFPGGTAAEIAIEGGIEVETSLNKDVNHHHADSLIVNNEVRSGVHLSGDQHPGSVKKHIVIDSSSSNSGEINLSNSGSLETSQINSQITTNIQSGTKTFLDRVAADVAIEGGIEVETSLTEDTSQDHADSLIFNNEIRAGVQISGDLTSGSKTEQIEIGSSSSSEESSSSYSGSIETSLHSDSQINSQVTTNIQSGSISAHNRLEGTKSFLDRMAADVAIEEGIEVETSLNEDTSQGHAGSLIFNNEIRGGVQVSGDLASQPKTGQIEIDSSSSSGESSSSFSGSIESSLNSDSQINSQITTNIQSGSISAHNRLEGTKSFLDRVAADVAIGEGIEVETSLNEDTSQGHAGSLIFNNEIRGGVQVSGDLASRPKTGQIEIDSSSSSGESSSSFSGSIESSLNSDSQINSQVTTNIQSGSISAHSRLEGTKSFLDRVAADVAMEGGIEVETSLHEDTSHRHTGSLIVNNDIRSGVEIDSSSSSEEFGSSESMETSLNTDSHINSQISTKIQSGSISSRSQPDIAIVETSLDEETRHNHADSLIVNTEVRSGVQISGSTTDQIEVDSSSSSDEIGSSDSGIIETQVFFGGISSPESISSESSEISNEFGQISAGGEFKVATEDVNREVQGSDQLSIDLQSGVTSQIAIGASGAREHEQSFESGRGISQTTNVVEGDVSLKTSAHHDISSSIDLSNAERVLESEVAIDSGFDNSITSQVTVSKTSASQDSGIQTGGSIGLHVSTESQIELPDLAVHKGCSSGECGVTGKLFVGSDDVGESSNHHHEGGLKIALEKTLTIDHGMIEEIPEAESEHLITKLIEDIGQSKRSEESGYFSADLEGSSVTKVNLNSETNIGVETSEQESPSATINVSTDVHVDVEQDDDQSTVYEEEAIEQELGGATINVDIQINSYDDIRTVTINREDSIATESSDIAVDLSATKNLEALGGATSLNGEFRATIDLGDVKNNRNRHHHTSTYDEYGGGYSTAGHHHQGSQGECSYLQNFDGTRSYSYFADKADYCDADKIFSNAQYRLTNSDDNCTGINAALNPECQRLNTVLWQSRDSGAPITLRTVKTYLSHGQELASEMQNRAQWLCNKGLIPKRHTPAMLHLINNFASQSTVEINLESEYSLFGTKLLQRRLSSEFHVTANTFVEFLRHHSFRIIGEEEDVVRPKRCPADVIYRSFDGSCNNQEHPTWGQSNTAFSRLLPARYHDGVHEIPKSVTGRELPNARAVSVHCFSRKDIHDRKLTLALAQFAQLVSHDLGMQTIDQTVQGGIQCCADGNRPLPKNLQHHSCLPIDISKDDKFYSKFGSSCMNFVRSMTICREDGTLGPAEQLNTVTSYLDASPVYGSNKETCDKLRAFRGGRMKVSIRRGRELLPSVVNASRYCDVMSPNEVCYLAGDIRVNQNPQMAILQTLFLREHNSIADRLAILNPHWDDERVFQETRRIVIAEYQCITYNEWLPLVIGEKYCRTHRLTPRFINKMSRDHNRRVKAATINAFSTGAFRVFHSMVDGHLNLCPASREISHTLRLSNHYFRPQIIEQYDNLDDLIRGLVTQSMNAADKNFNPEITEYLFRSRNEFGLDLEALDIQRARDHGIPSYNKFRELCGLRKAECFEDLIEEIPCESIAMLQRIYEDVNDIDLIVGVALERRAPGCAVGPTARCLIGEQFYRCRVGDRFFYNNAGHDHSFTRAQFEEISKASFARLLCNTGDNIEEIQCEAFRTISPNNPLEYCCALGTIDLSPWKESIID